MSDRKRYSERDVVAKCQETVVRRTGAVFGHATPCGRSALPGTNHCAQHQPDLVAHRALVTDARLALNHAAERADEKARLHALRLANFITDAFSVHGVPHDVRDAVREVLVSVAAREDAAARLQDTLTMSPRGRATQEVAP